MWKVKPGVIRKLLYLNTSYQLFLFSNMTHPFLIPLKQDRYSGVATGLIPPHHRHSLLHKQQCSNLFCAQMSTKLRISKYLRETNIVRNMHLHIQRSSAEPRQNKFKNTYAQKHYSPTAENQRGSEIRKHSEKDVVLYKRKNNLNHHGFHIINHEDDVRVS